MAGKRKPKTKDKGGKVQRTCWALPLFIFERRIKHGKIC